MKTISHFLLALAILRTFAAAEDGLLPNPLIDYKTFYENAAKVQKLREDRRVSEDDFIHLAAERGTIVLDARSDSKFAMLHVKGARHLSLPDITADELAKIIPTKSTRVLIYCNNNFQNEPQALPPKSAWTSLNIYTFNTLYGYGYTNIYELGPLIDIKKSHLAFQGTLVHPTKQPSPNDSTNAPILFSPQRHSWPYRD